MTNQVDYSKIKVNLEGKVAVIFGASVGIGASTAKLFAESGAKVVLGSRNIKACEESVAEIKKAGGEACAIKLSVENYDEVKAAVDLAVSTYGGLDIIVNNAGINSDPQLLHEISEESYDKLMDVNLKGMWRGMKAGMPELMKHGGTVVNISSDGGIVGAPGISTYCATKHGVIGLSKSAALDYAEYGIRVNVVAPGISDTAIFNDWQNSDEQRQKMIDLHPIRRVSKPHEIAAAIAWLASDASSFVTGAVLVVDGGYSVA